MKSFWCLMLMLFSGMSYAGQTTELLEKVSSALTDGLNPQAVSYFRQAVGYDIVESEMFYWTSVDKSSEVSTKFVQILVAGYQDRADYDKAFLFYKELLQRDPLNIDYLQACADTELKRGNSKETTILYEKILELDADNLSANIYLGNYYYLKAEQDRRKLDADYRKIATPTRMQHARYRDALGLVFSSGYEKAKNFLKRVIKLFPSTEARKTLNKIGQVEKELQVR